MSCTYGSKRWELFLYCHLIFCPKAKSNAQLQESINEAHAVVLILYILTYLSINERCLSLLNVCFIKVKYIFGLFPMICLEVLLHEYLLETASHMVGNDNPFIIKFLSRWLVIEFHSRKSCPLFISFCGSSSSFLVDYTVSWINARMYVLVRRVPSFHVVAALQLYDVTLSFVLAPSKDV